VSAVTRTYRITNELGMHMRAAAAFVQTANRFAADVEVEKDGQRVNGKSLMGVLLLAAAKGTEISLTCRGRDAEAALNALGSLIQSKFGLGE
jgi:phosphocarrier protein HPr